MTGQRQHILLVTGVSGAGKTTALHVLEDLGWEAVDNFPIRLLESFVSEAAGDPGPLAIGFDARTRGFVPAEIIELVGRLAQREDLSIATLFLDCGSGELERRYNETRRRHPLSESRAALDGIRAERELMEPLRSWADMVIDTTTLSSNELQQFVRQRFEDVAPDALTVTVSSFGFARGMPPLADLVFDMRYLDNPHWAEGLREQTGRDEAVGEYIERDGAFAETFPRMRDLVIDLLPRYRKQGKAYVHVAFGCTGGRHRSVYTAERMAQALREGGISPTVIHRNLASRTADRIESQ
ncbi:RNase adapter RapZ [Erythrobacter sp. LQ02-29]|uniref:RNase adapter RapZ n=1 Tax=Erythrobacter sp. LQ02-29 TaxID=2920384 RepID=UPI001F4DF4E9|nr:RNase adapter RapZ [Erythrobacter sp. LQ02-29]MCP9222300.1 RNase adapter RapZ [Erythrobacter sp. LQ02-29]